MRRVGCLRLLGLDRIGVDEGLGEHVAERLGPDVLLAAAILDGAVARARVMEAQMMAASADWLRIRRELERGLPLLLKLAFRGDDGQPPRVATLQCSAKDRRHDEDQPPVALSEVDHGIHAIILPHRLG